MSDFLVTGFIANAANKTKAKSSRFVVPWCSSREISQHINTTSSLLPLCTWQIRRTMHSTFEREGPSSHHVLVIWTIYSNNYIHVLVLHVQPVCSLNYEHLLCVGICVFFMVDPSYASCVSYITSEFFFHPITFCLIVWLVVLGFVLGI